MIVGCGKTSLPQVATDHLKKRVRVCQEKTDSVSPSVSVDKTLHGQSCSARRSLSLDAGARRSLSSAGGVAIVRWGTDGRTLARHPHPLTAYTENEYSGAELAV